MSGASKRTLVQRVAARLEEGPVHTLALAREILRLEGHPGAASAAIFTLIGSDPRFSVDAGGMWSLQGPAPGRSLGELSFAVVDVETTGGRPRDGDRITEIAVVEVKDGAVVDEYQSLVNPGRTIPPMVERLTGISGGMVRTAPYFEHVAPEVARRLEGRVFVAHNVGFDHAFVIHELQQAMGEAPGGRRSAPSDSRGACSRDYGDETSTRWHSTTAFAFMPGIGRMAMPSRPRAS